MKARVVFVSALLGATLLAIPMQSQAFFFGFGGGFGFGVGGWGYPYYAGYHPGYWGRRGYWRSPRYALARYRHYALYRYPHAIAALYPHPGYLFDHALPIAKAPEIAEK